MECADGLVANFKRSIGDDFPRFIDGIKSSASARNLLSGASPDKKKAAVSRTRYVTVAGHRQRRRRHFLPHILGQVIDGAVQTWPETARIVRIKMAVAAPDKQVLVDDGGSSTDSRWHRRRRHRLPLHFG